MNKTRICTLYFIAFLTLPALLVGCSGLHGPHEINQSKLKIAQQKASFAVNTAKKYTFNEDEPDSVVKAKKIFDETLAKHKRSPSMDLIEQYDQVTSLSEEAITKTREKLENDLSTLRRNNKMQESRISSLEGKIEQLKESLQNSYTIQFTGNSNSELRSALLNMKNQSRGNRIKPEIYDHKVLDIRRLYDKLLAESIGRVKFEKLPLVIRFERGSAKLNPKYKFELKSLSNRLKKSNHLIQIRGYPDLGYSLKNSTFESEWDLSTQRAVNVLEFLVDDLNLNESRMVPFGVGKLKTALDLNGESPSKSTGRVELYLYPPQINLDKI